MGQRSVQGENLYGRNLTTPYTYDGYNGVQENIVKYTLATAPADPEMNGYQFIGWFYKDGEAEKPFSFTMPITKDYDLYPKFSEPTIINYTVHYYKDGTTEKVADDRTNSVMIGTTVTEKAKMGKDLNLVPADMQNKYYPTKTSTSVNINQIDQEIIFFYTEATSVEYTVCYQDVRERPDRPGHQDNGVFHRDRVLCADQRLCTPAVQHHEGTVPPMRKRIRSSSSMILH